MYSVQYISLNLSLTLWKTSVCTISYLYPLEQFLVTSPPPPNLPKPILLVSPIYLFCSLVCWFFVLFCFVFSVMAVAPFALEKKFLRSDYKMSWIICLNVFYVDIHLGVLRKSHVMDLWQLQIWDSSWNGDVTDQC